MFRNSLRPLLELERYFPAEPGFSKEAETLNYPQEDLDYSECNIFEQTEMCGEVQKTTKYNLNGIKLKNERIEHVFLIEHKCILKTAP